MSVYHQMGHDSVNLLAEPDLAAYRGAILSPVNYALPEVVAQVEAARDRDGFETIFDPQLYFPRTEHACLREWSYFPTDVDTADLASTEWWSGVIDALGLVCEGLRPTAICSPAIVPRVFSDDYYARVVENGILLHDRLSNCDVRILQTALVGMDDIATAGRAQEVASILTATPADQIYLILYGSVEPRREFGDPEPLKGAMRLIASLRQAEFEVLVGFSSSDAILWKAAGASSVATGKFFNLRRFTSSRFDPPAGGGGQVPYWFEESLMAFLRQSDVLRVQQRSLLSAASLTNPFGAEILNQMATDPQRSWLGLSWRHFLYWFADIEARIEGGLSVRALLQTAEANWQVLEDNDVLMEETRNNGNWVRPWRRALAEYASF
jgi:hypothetical protein